MSSQTSKCLNYLSHPWTGPYFATFMLIWAYLRHFLNLKLLYSLFPFSLGFGTPNQFATVGPYDLNWETQQYKCWISHIITFFLLATLQAVNIFWYFLICRILTRYIMSSGLADERSDDEAEGEGEDESETPALEAEKDGKANGHVTGNGVPKLPDLAVNGQPVDSEAEVMAAQDRKASLRKR